MWGSMQIFVMHELINFLNTNPIYWYERVFSLSNMLKETIYVGYFVKAELDVDSELAISLWDNIFFLPSFPVFLFNLLKWVK